MSGANLGLLLYGEVSVTKFDVDSVKNERVSMETPFSYYKCMGFF